VAPSVLRSISNRAGIAKRKIGRYFDLSELSSVDVFVFGFVYVVDFGQRAALRP
jgi:hypothetical protein